MLEVSSLKLVVKTMFPSELSTIDIALLAAITVLIILYVTLLLRLRPSSKQTLETPTKKETHIEDETRPKKPERTITPHQTIRQELSEKPKTPEETQPALEKIVPKKYFYDFNELFVQFGQNVCVPVSPFCSKCKINKYCPKIGVKRNR